MSFQPKLNDLVYDNQGYKLTIVYSTVSGDSVVGVDNNEEIFIFEKVSPSNRFVDQMDRSVYLLGLATQSTWNIFQQMQDIEND